MAIQIGQQLGSLEITALLGKGGKGEVYRARDTKLKRDVAIKILPDEFARDPDRANRFQREAEVLASLNHPDIAAIYDVQEAGGTRFLVLELVEGETEAFPVLVGSIFYCLLLGGPIPSLGRTCCAEGVHTLHMEDSLENLSLSCRIDTGYIPADLQHFSISFPIVSGRDDRLGQDFFS